MNYIGRPDFEDDRITELVGDVCGLLGGIGDGVFGRYKTIGLKNFF